MILNGLLALTDTDRRVQDPFVLAFRDVARDFMSDTWGDDRQNLREPAMLLSARMLDDPAEQVTILRAGLRDRSPQIQVAAAREAAALGLPSMTPEILKRYSASDDVFALTSARRSSRSVQNVGARRIPLIKDFLTHLGEAATSTLALAAYIVVVAAWAFKVWQRHRIEGKAEKIIEQFKSDEARNEALGKLLVAPRRRVFPGRT